MSGPASVQCCIDLPMHYGRVFALAARNPRRATTLARRWREAVRPDAHRDQALAAYALGYTLLCWERLDEAERLFVEARTASEAITEPQLALDAERALLFLRVLRGGGAEADVWSAMVAGYERLNAPLAAARTRMAHMIQLNLQGLGTAALDLARRIEPVVEQHGTGGDRAWLQRIAAVAHLNVGAFDQALLALQAAEVGFATLKQHTELAKTWLERLRLHELRGNLAGALADVERAYQVVTRLDLPLRTAFCEKHMGWLAALCGVYDRGILFSLRAYDHFARLGRPDALADCDLNLGNIAYFAGLPNLALAAYERAEAIYVQREHHRMRLVCQRNRALALRLQSQPHAALQLLDRLIRDAEALGERVEVAEACYARGQNLADLGRVNEADAAFIAAEARFRDLGNTASAGRSQLERGWLLLQQGHSAAAEAHLRSAAPSLHEQPIHLWRADYGLARCAEERGAWAEAQDRYLRACLTVARLRRRLVNEHASSGLFAQAQALIDDAADFAWRRRDAEMALNLSELQRSLAMVAATRATRVGDIAQHVDGVFSHASLRHAAADAMNADDATTQAFHSYLEARLRNRRLPLLEDDDALKTLDLAGLRATFARTFSAGWTLLIYLPIRGRVLMIVLDAETLSLAATPFDDRLRWLLDRATLPEYRWLTYAVANATPGGDDWPVLAELSDRLIPAWLHTQLHPTRRLLIVAGGALHGLPWAGLRINGRWLVEQATPQLLPGLLIWQELNSRTPSSNDALLLGVSQFGERAPYLPGVRATLDLIAQHWRGHVSRLEEAQVQVGELLKQAGRGELRHYGLIHIATHGRLVPSSGLLAHLKLWDEDLLYDDIAQLGLGGALVVLAACEGAAAEVLPGEELLSLSRAFLLAGARDVIASEWNLYDNAAPLLLALLYDEIATGLDPAAALATAQRRWLQSLPNIAGGDVLARAPLVWSGLTALGACSPAQT